MAAVVPGSRAVSVAEPATAVPPEVVDTWSRHAPGDGIATSATYETVSTPGGWTGTASTGLPAGEPSAFWSCTAGCRLASFNAAPPADSVKMTGLELPDQTDDETTATSSAVGGAAVALEIGAAVGGGAAGEPAPALGDDTAVVATTCRMTAVMVGASVPNGNRARSMPFASTRKTSAVCDIE